MFKKLAITLALSTALAAPAQANDDVFKGILATIVIHKVLNSTEQGYSDGHDIRPAPQHHYPSERSAPGYYDSSRSCRVDVHRGDYYTTRTVYNCQGAILEHQSWPSN
jgi:hypothetical protein